MTNTDVEDVLASIRRLVSDNTRPGASSVQQPPSDRLVLTPSLRVPEADAADDSDEDAAEDMAQEVDVEAMDEDALAEFAESAFSKEKAKDEARIDVRAQGFTPADPSAVVAALSAELTKPSTPVTEPEQDVEEASEADNAAETDAHEDFADSDVSGDDDEAVWPSDEHGEDGDAEDESALIASAVAASDTDDDGEVASDPHVPEDWAREVDAVTAAPETDDADDEAPSEQAAKPLPKSLSEKVAALETLVGERRDQFEPDDLGADAYAGTEPPAMEWEDADVDEDEDESTAEDIVADVIEAEEDAVFQDADADTSESQPDAEEIEASPEPQAAPEPSEDAASGATSVLFSTDDDVLDEDALRELISDIVREELQGALGERITRNVRKLVRREIHRALAAQDLE
ncbi:hypothetical protein ACERZ8_11930 [Tateyamaria armeniaca]|uniref:Glycerol-3-phosphate dehydrogenase n=1 Tax=Tateyamaria armeniaca TaxID=2518930 RepID=A0ABW8UZH5_9RHOB